MTDLLERPCLVDLPPLPPIPPDDQWRDGDRWHGEDPHPNTPSDSIIVPMLCGLFFGLAVTALMVGFLG